MRSSFPHAEADQRAGKRRRTIVREPIVITGIGLTAAVGKNRESVWRSVQDGRSNFRFLRGIRGIPDDQFIGAPVEFDEPIPGRLKALTLSEMAAAEAVQDARLLPESVDSERFGCMLSAHMGDTRWLDVQLGKMTPQELAITPWWEQWLPNSAC